jgi:glycosyltransferase involved in cell wall biosynthesis
MGRGRGKTGLPTLLVENRSGNMALGIYDKSIQPGQFMELTAEEMANPGVEKWLARGILGKVRMGTMMKRLVAEKPRILVVVHTLFRGGAEISTIELHRHLKVMGCEQALLNIYVGDTGNATMLTEDAQEIFDIYMHYNVSERPKVKGIVRDFALEYNPDIIMYSLLREVPESLIAIADRPPCIQVMHSELADSHSAYSPSGTDAVITVSKAMARTIITELDVPKEKVFTVWNGINPEKIYSGKSLREELGIPKTGAVIGMVGNLNELKRPLVGLEAFATVRRPRSHMIFAGNDVDLGNAVRARIQELGLPRYVHILGLREDVENVYATIDIMMNCSTMEGLPMTIVEGMFASLPVIASDVGGNSELVEHEKTGYVFHPGNPHSLATYLDRLLGDTRLRTRMGRAARLRANEKFHIDTVADQYLDILKRYTLSPEHQECSVVMPVWNGAQWLDRAIWSVRRQTYPYFELIILDDGSTDESVEIIDKHLERDRRIRLIKLEHGGIVKALNAGISESKTPLIVRMDVDDEMVPNRLELQMAFMEENRQVDVVGTQMLGRSADGTDMGPMAQMPLSHREIEKAMYTQNPMCHPTVMFRKSAWKKVGGYKGDGRCEDYRMWSEMVMAGCRLANMEEALLIYQHTHDGDHEYSTWRDSVLQEIQQNYIEGMAS